MAKLNDKIQQEMSVQSAPIKTTECLRNKEAARVLSVSPKTLNNWRWQGIGPRFIKGPGRKGMVLYSRQSLEDWLASNSFESTTQAQFKSGGK